jgi:hypothetical protein
MKRLRVTLFVWLLAAASTAGVLPPAHVYAQSNSDAPAPAHVRRPYRGIFGGSADPDSPQSLTLSASAFGAYDENVFAALTGRRRAADRRLQHSGAYSGAHAALTYSFSRSGRRASVGAIGSAQANYYRFGEVNAVTPHYHGGVNGRLSLGRSTNLNGSQRVVLSENHRLLFFPLLSGSHLIDSDDEDGAVAADPDLELFQQRSLRHTTNVSLSHQLGRRSSLDVGYRRYYIDFIEGHRPDFRTQGASVSFDHRLTSHATLTLGYAYRDGRSAADRRRAVHNVNLGLNYSRALSLSRRTRLGFSTGSAMVASENVGAAELDPRTRVRLIGNASLVHELGRTWTAQVAYRRALIFREGFGEPFFTDGVIGSIGGLPSRRLQLSALAGWSVSSLNRAGRTRHDATWASAHARYALNRYLAAYVRYVYYAFDFGADVPLDPDFPRTLDRQGVRVGVMTSVPLIR